MAFIYKLGFKEKESLIGLVMSNSNICHYFSTHSNEQKLAKENLAAIRIALKSDIDPKTPIEVDMLKNAENMRLKKVVSNNNMVRGQTIRVKDKYKCTRGLQPEFSTKKVLLDHLKNLRYNGYSHLYVRFGDEQILARNTVHHEKFRCFFGGIKSDSNGDFLKANGKDFIDCSGNSISYNAMENLHKNLRDRNRELVDNGHSEYDECNTIGGVIYDIGKSIVWVSTNFKKDNDKIYLIPTYERNPQFVGNCTCSGKGITTILFSDKPRIKINDFKLLKSVAGDAGTGCCP